MSNKEFANLLFEVADYLEIKGSKWEPRAYRRAAQTVSGLGEDLKDIYKSEGKKGLEGLEGIGKGITKSIIEYITTGKVADFEAIRDSMPEGVRVLMSVPGMGPKKAWKLNQELKISSVDDLKKAAEEGKIAKLAGFGEKSQADILERLGPTKGERHMLSVIVPLAELIKASLKKQAFVQKVEIAGSIRRARETAKDIDVLVVSKQPEKVMRFVSTLPRVTLVNAQGPTRSALVFDGKINCDVRVVPEKSFGSALAYFTGSKEHNIQMRRIAIKKGMKLSEWGLFDKNEKYLVGKTEEEIYKKLKVPYVPPELREMQGEFNTKIPKLVELKDLQGDCHMHSTYSDGKNELSEMIAAAKKKGYKYVAVTDHSQSLEHAHGLTEVRLKQKFEELDKLQKKCKGIKLLKSAEVDILAHGGLDYSDKMLDECDFVLGALHRSFNGHTHEMTDRIIDAFNTGRLHAFAHPFQRKIGVREH